MATIFEWSGKTTKGLIESGEISANSKDEVIAQLRKRSITATPVVAAAVRLGCDALVTGDRSHFGALFGRTFAGVKIHSPRLLAEELLRLPKTPR